MSLLQIFVALSLAPPDPVPVHPECEIYRHVVWSASQNMPGAVWLQSETRTLPDQDFWRAEVLQGEMPDVPPDMIHQLSRINRRSVPLPCVPETERGIRLIPLEQIAALVDRAAGRRFERVDPEIYMIHAVSRVAFNEASDEALVLVVSQCGARCGFESIEHYVREDGEWVHREGHLLLQY